MFACVAAAAERPSRTNRARDELERDVATEHRVVGAIHDAHAAASEHGLDAIATELRADQRRVRRDLRSARELSEQRVLARRARLVLPVLHSSRPVED
jgi:hypothetical protein